MQTESERAAVKAWNVMGGLDWIALPAVAELVGATDIELLIAHLVAIREYANKPKE